MRSAFIIHGAYGSPFENWIPWLSEEVKTLGYEPITPSFPTPDGQNLQSWLDIAEPYSHNLNDRSIIVGHSIACAFILNFLERINKKVKAVFLVAPFIDPLENEVFDAINATFYEKPFDWEKIKTRAENFYIFHSDNDPYVPIERADEVAEGLETPIITVKNAGHFNKESGYEKFDLLLEKIRELE